MAPPARRPHIGAVRVGHVHGLRVHHRLGLREALAPRLRELHETVERGQDADALAIIVAVVALFVFTVVGLIMSIDLLIYFTVD